MEQCDVLVVGGGVAGTMAAIAAARKGCAVTLLERGGCLGGMWTAGLIGITLDGKDKCALLDEFSSRVQKETELSSATLFETQKYILEEMCREAGVRVLYFAQVSETHEENGVIRSVSYLSKSLKSEISPKIVIDATGDGDIAAMSGCAFDFGRPEDGKTQPMSMVALLTGLNADAAEPYLASKDKPFWTPRNNFRALTEKAGLSVSMGGCANITRLAGDVYILSINQEYGRNGCSAQDITDAVMDARQEIYHFVRQLKLRCPEIFGNIMLLSTPEMIGVRESRRIKCRYTVTLQDMLEGKRHEDAICTVHYWPDIHSPEKDAKGFLDGGLEIHPYDLPFRALLPLGKENLLVAGRCIGGDFYAHSSYRVMGNMAAVGDAAGRAAARSIASGAALKDLKYDKNTF